MSVYKKRGTCVFAYVQDQVRYYIRENKEEDIQIDNITKLQDLLNDIENNIITTDDGYIRNIYINNYATNLGLTHKGFVQGSFIVDSEYLKKLELTHKIDIEWIDYD